MLEKILSTEPSALLTVARVGLGFVMLPHGAQKLLGWFGGYGFSQTVSFFSSLGIPTAIGTLIVLAESFGALALILGLGTRFAALGITVTMIGAAIFQRQHGFFMNWFGQQQGEGFEYHLLAIALGLILVVGGGGLFSLDDLLTRRS
ncbi:MAG: DoxX family protein [Spirochaetes bacterium]|nr:DoxX family protein [Spirochaetota bacterium]